jgi:hypothetical protein
VENKINQQINNKEQRKKQTYKPPRIVTYSEKEILEHIGPAQACSPQPCSLNP